MSLETGYRMVALLKAKPRTVPELVRLVGAHENSVRRNLAEMEAQNLVTFDGFRETATRGQHPTIYRWAP
jgi:DNA-binding IclR family transcriptional regulator